MESNYRRLAQRFVADRYGSPPALRHHRKEWWAWTKGCYSVESEDDVTSRLQDWLDEEKESAKIKDVKEVMAQVKGLPNVKIDDSMDMPLFVEIDHYDPTCNYLTFRDQIIDMDVLANAGRGIRRNLTPNWFSSVALDYDYSPEAECPRFLKLLDQLLPDNPSQDALQEFSGYCLTKDTSMKTMMILYGEHGTGKSTLANILEALVGKQNCSALPLESFGERFAMDQCQGKLANFCGDCNQIDKLAEGVLKRFTGGDTVPVDQKFKKVYNCKMTAKIIVATNVFPRVRDITDATWGRFMVVPMDQRIKTEDIDRSFLNSEAQNWPFRRELSGIFNWAIAGLQRLRCTGRFTESQKFIQAKADARVANCSLTQFFVERCEAAGYTEPTRGFMNEYLCYCDSYNLPKLTGVEVLTILRRLVPGLEKRKLGPRGEQEWVFTGIKLHIPRD